MLLPTHPAPELFEPQSRKCPSPHTRGYRVLDTKYGFQTVPHSTASPMSSSLLRVRRSDSRELAPISTPQTSQRRHRPVVHIQWRPGASMSMLPCTILHLQSQTHAVLLCVSNDTLIAPRSTTPLRLPLPVCMYTMSRLSNTSTHTLLSTCDSNVPWFPFYDREDQGSIDLLPYPNPCSPDQEPDCFGTKWPSDL